VCPHDHRSSSVCRLCLPLVFAGRGRRLRHLVVIVEHLWLRRLHAVHRLTRPGLRLRRSQERQLAPLCVAERGDDVAVRHARRDALEVERVGALAREDGLPVAGAHATETDGAWIALHPSKNHLGRNSCFIESSWKVESIPMSNRSITPESRWHAIGF
jgi:hypothetical protein